MELMFREEVCKHMRQQVNIPKELPVLGLPWLVLPSFYVYLPELDVSIIAGCG